MAVKTLYVDFDLLNQKIKDAGYKKCYICECLGLSKQGFWKKLHGITPFRIVEVNFLCNLLNITVDERVKIFKPKVETEVD